MLSGVRAQACFISGLSLQQVLQMMIQFKAMAYAGGTRWVCAVTGTTAPGFSAISGIHATPTSLLFCRFFGGFSKLPVLVCNPKGAIKCQTRLPHGRNVVDYWIVLSRESFHGRI